jgi:thiol-disulfide isomerase/thioredoxin
VGDDAPPLVQGTYVQGEPVREFEQGKVYVVEMWATWCGPCVQAMPHVTELQREVRGPRGWW